MTFETQVIDDFLPKVYQDTLEKELLSVKFPWYFNEKTVNKLYEDGCNTKRTAQTIDTFQFVHVVFGFGNVLSDYFNLISPLTYHLMLTANIDTTKLLRIKCNLNLPVSSTSNESHFLAHRDFAESEIINCVYYVNDSDGETIFFDESCTKEINRVSPKKGRLVCFDNKILHAGSPPINYDARCVINFSFKKESENELRNSKD